MGDGFDGGDFGDYPDPQARPADLELPAGGAGKSGPEVIAGLIGFGVWVLFPVLLIVLALLDLLCRKFFGFGFLQQTIDFLTGH
ncbi:hypothetical protein FJY63_13365 [Candidatus Sumerlaeota bacterium]|nr:hypothetical protein [Candidatus Sumerlaeota bacterium]